MSTADILRAQILASTDPDRLEREARRGEVRGARSLVDRLHDLEASLRLDGRHMESADVRETIELLQSYNLGEFK